MCYTYSHYSPRALVFSSPRRLAYHLVLPLMCVCDGCSSTSPHVAFSCDLSTERQQDRDNADSCLMMDFLLKCLLEVKKFLSEVNSSTH